VGCNPLSSSKVKEIFLFLFLFSPLSSWSPKNNDGWA
jgi:hypothetical protein